MKRHAYPMLYIATMATFQVRHYSWPLALLPVARGSPYYLAQRYTESRAGWFVDNIAEKWSQRRPRNHISKLFLDDRRRRGLSPDDRIFDVARLLSEGVQSKRSAYHHKLSKCLSILHLRCSLIDVRDFWKLSFNRGKHQRSKAERNVRFEIYIIIRNCAKFL